MKKIVQLSEINQYNSLAKTNFSHDLVTILDLSKGQILPADTYNYGVYGIYLVEGACGDLQYGRNYYTHSQNSIGFTAPGQVMTHSFDSKIHEQVGMSLLFHPDLIKGFPLGEKIQKYSFFTYDVSETLKLSENEKDTDKHSNEIIVANIELLLTYSQRFFDRQDYSICEVNKGIIERFEQALNHYFQSQKPLEHGLPTVAYFADQLHLSSNYLGGQIKKETGCSAQEYIQAKILDIAKEQLLDPTKTISQVSFDLGYQYPHHFTRFFQQKAGCSPSEYRQGQ